jgi:hypothetical protein
MKYPRNRTAMLTRHNDLVRGVQPDRPAQERRNFDMTTQRSIAARVVSQLETLADRALMLSIPAFAAFMALALIHVG